MSVDLSKYSSVSFNRGASKWTELAWRVVTWSLFRVNFVTAYRLKSKILRMFGAKVGKGIYWKPSMKVTFPWKLNVGDYCWIGEEAWLLNLDRITIGNNVCISQRAFLCTGSHDWSKETFDLITKPIVIEDGVWISANVFVGAGVTIGKNSVVTVGSVVTKDLPPNMICSGNPAEPVKSRKIEDGYPATSVGERSFD